MILRVELGVLHLSGSTAGNFALAPYEVRRLRFFRRPRRPRSAGYDQVELWREGHHRPLSIDTLDGDTEAFGQVAAAFARAVAMSRGSAALEVGATGLAAVQLWARLLIGGAAWLAVLGGSIWILTGLVRALVVVGLLAIGWREWRRLRTMRRAGALLRRDLPDLTDFPVGPERRGVAGQDPLW